MVYKASLIFTGHEMLKDHVMLVTNGLIEKIFPIAEINTKENIADLGDVILAPAPRPIRPVTR